MRHPTFLPLALLALALTISGAYAAAAGAGAAADDGRTMHLIEHEVSIVPVEMGPPGLSMGDVEAFGNPVFNADNTHQVGRDQGFCLIANMNVGGGIIADECSATLMLDGGSLTFEGPFYSDVRDVTWAITGGTGAYRSARGDMTLHARNSAYTEFDFVIHLIR